MSNYKKYKITSCVPPHPWSTYDFLYFDGTGRKLHFENGVAYIYSDEEGLEPFKRNKGEFIVEEVND